jgi:phosphomevalonate kinase
MAVDRRVVAEVSEASGAHHVITTPGLADGSWRFTVDSDDIDWLDHPPEGVARLISAAAATIARHPSRALSITIDSRAFFDTASQAKLGLGSSAAVVVALAGALTESAGNGETAVEVAHELHRRLQQGHGSGIDVATSLSGGIIEFRMAEAGAPVRLDWPPGLSYRFLWSGRPADTLERIRELSADSFCDGPGAELLRAAHAVVDAWRNGSDVLAALGDYGDRLRQFGDANDLGIYGAGHDAVATLAATHDVVYKPCGAGGGDIGVAFAHSEDAIDRLINQLPETGFVPLSLALDTRGIVVET